MQMHLPLADRTLILHFLVMRAQQQNGMITANSNARRLNTFSAFSIFSSILVHNIDKLSE